MMILRVLKNKLLLMMLITVLSAQSVWADPVYAPDHDSKWTLSIGSLGDYAEVYPGWTSFTTPTIDVHETTNDLNSITSKYVLTYVIDGKTSADKVDDDAKAGHQVTIDATTGTKVDYTYGNITVGSFPGTVTVRVIATPKSVFATTEGLTELSKKYSFKIDWVDPTVEVSPNNLKINIYHYDGTDSEPRDNKKIFTNTSSMLTLPTTSVYIEKNGHKQDLSKIYDVEFSVKAGSEDNLIIGTTESSIQGLLAGDKYVAAKLTNEQKGNLNSETVYKDSEGIELADYKPFSTSTEATLIATFTPKDAYKSECTTVTKEIGVTIQQLENKYTADLDLEGITEASSLETEKDPSNTLSWVRWNENSCKHQLPHPIVTSSNGTDLSANNQVRICYFAIEDETELDNCMVNEASPYGEVWPAGEETSPNSMLRRDVTLDFPLHDRIGNDAVFDFQSGKAGHLKIGVFAYIPDGEKYDFNADQLYNWYQIEEEKVLEINNVPESYNNSNRSTTYRRITPVKYFYIDILKRVPKLKFEPDPESQAVSTADEITFNNRYELSGYIGDENDGTAGTLEFGADQWGSDHFSYSFEFDKNSGIQMINWPHGDKIFALDSDGNKVEPLGYDDHGNPYWVKYKKKTVIHEMGGWSWSEEVDDERDEAINTITLAEAKAYNEKVGKTVFNVEGAADDATFTADIRNLISTYKYFSVKGYGTDHLWKMKFTKASGKDGENQPIPYEVKYTIYPYNHTRWDVGETKVYKFVVEEGKEPILNIDPKELVATISQAEFVEADVWVTDAGGVEISDDFTFHYEILTPNSTKTTVVDSNDKSFKHTVTIGNAAGDAIVKVTATVKEAKQGQYKTQNLEGTYTIHILGKAPLYEIISSKDTDSKDYESGKTDIDYGKKSVMGKLHFINPNRTVDDANNEKEYSIYAGYTIAGVPGLDIRLGAFDGNSTWTVKRDPTSFVGSKCNGNDTSTDGVGIHNMFIQDVTPVVTDSKGIAQSGSFFEFYAHTNGFLTIDARLEAGKSYKLIDYDFPEKYIIVTPEEEKKGDYTFPMLLQEDHSYHLYGMSEDGHINLHGLSFEPAFVHNELDKVAAQKGSAFLNGFKNVPTLTTQTWSDVTYESESDEYATVGSKDGIVNPQKLTITRGENGWVDIRAKVTSNIKSKDNNDIYKYPSYHLVIADIPMYRLGDNKRKNHSFTGDTALNKDGFDEGGKIYAPVPGDTVSTYNILTPIRMTYGGWKNEYVKNAKGDKAKDSYDPKTDAEIGGINANDTQFNKYIDGFTWSNVAKQNPIDENNNGDYKNYLTGVSNINTDYFKNTFTLPAKGAYWRFEPMTSGTIFVYLIQNGVCSYTGNPGLLQNTSKHYFGLDWKPLYIVDETGANVDATATIDSRIKNFLTGDSENAMEYTDGVIRCDMNDGDVWKAVKGVEKKKTEANDFSFVWEYDNGKTGDAKANTGFDVDYKDDSNRSAFKTKILAAWEGRGETESIFQDETSKGYTLISKAYVRYAIPVRAGKSYWVFQQGSKPNLCGFAFVPNGFPEQPQGIKATNIDIDDDVDLAISLSGKDLSLDYNVTYKNRAFKNKKWTSLCLPFAVSEQNFHKVFGENAKIVTFDNTTDGGSYAHFVQHNYRMMEAGRGYFIMPMWDDIEEGATKSNLTFEGVTFEMSDGTQTTSPLYKMEDKNVTDGLFMRGTINEESIPQYSYYINESLRRITNASGATLGRYRAYLRNESSNASLSRLVGTKMEEPFEDQPSNTPVTTEIRGVHDTTITDINSNGKINDGVYSIDGKFMGTNTSNQNKGIYIVNGKKHVIK